MMSNLGKRWLAVGVIWGVVFIISGVNLVHVSKIQSLRRELETVNMDKRYLKAKGSDIDQVRIWKTRFTHRVESFDLGFLVVENNLKQLSDRYGLEKVKMDAKNEFQDTRPVAIHVRASGTIPDLVSWLTAVEESYPYLAISQMEMNYDHRLRTGQLTATFAYHFSIGEDGWT